MQQRHTIASASSFEEARGVKEMLLGKFPDRKFQVRRSSKGFSVVERMTAAEAEKHKQEESSTYTKKRKKNRGTTV